MKAKALPCSIFESKRIGNCSNHGISEQYDEVLLLMPEGCVEIDLDDIPGNAVDILRRRDRDAGLPRPVQSRAL